MVLFPNCKINIGLRVTNKRADGYHNIQSIFYPLPLCDVLEFAENKALKFTSSGIQFPEGGGNSCLQAWEILRKAYQIPPVHMHLHKAIPSGAGLGGGSADGAFAIKGLAAYFGLEIDEEKMQELSLQIGSDCPFFIRNRPAYITGRGEVMQPLEDDPIKGLWCVLIHPNIHVPTGKAYSMLTPAFPDHNVLDIWHMHYSKWEGFMLNDFEKAVFQLHPQVAHIKALLYEHGAIYASMSGSGSSVYGFFIDEPTTENMQRPGQFVWKGKL